MKKTKTLLLLLFLSALLFTLGACNDAIFYKISVEQERVEPRIKGSPTNFTVFGGYMYVASGKTLYKYKDGIWEENESINGLNIVQLAADGTSLYALCFEDTTSGITRKIFKKTATEPWLENTLNISDEHNIIQSIYSAGNELYIGAQRLNANDFAIYKIDGNNASLVVEGRNDGLLNGAATDGNNTFLCTRNGIFYSDGSVIEGSNINFIGIIALPNKEIVAITRNGNLYKVETTGLTHITGFSDNRWASGSIGLWQNVENLSQHILLVGRQDREYSTTTGYTYGYMELELDSSGGIVSDKSFREPGRTSEVLFSSVDENEPYVSSLGRQPVNHIFQAPDMILFASTQKDGVWSYRARQGKRQWNAED